MTENRDRQSSYRLLAQYGSIVFILPSTTLGGYLLGRWLDEKLELFPWLTVTFVLLGAVGGFIEIFRLLNRKS